MYRHQMNVTAVKIINVTDDDDGTEPWTKKDELKLGRVEQKKCRKKV